MFPIIIIHLLHVLALADPINLNYTTCEFGNPFIPRAYGYPDTLVSNNGTTDLYWGFNANGTNSEAIDAYSSLDLVTWISHTPALYRGGFNWTTGPIFSVSAVARGDTYYLFFSTTDPRAVNVTSIGVGIANKPEGPHIDHIGKALLRTNGTSTNATAGLSVIITGEYHDAIYMYFASEGKANVVKLDANMTELALSPFEDGQVIKDITPRVDGTAGPFIGDPTILERDGHYYLLWKDTQNGTIRYATAENPTGPFLDRGIILEPDPAVADSIGHATHLRIANTDIWYMIYSRRLGLDGDADLMSGLAYDRMYFGGNDSSISPVRMLVTHNFDLLDTGHAQAIWKEYKATYDIGKEIDVFDENTTTRFTDGVGDGRSMMYNNFSDLVYDAQIGLGKYDPSTFTLLTL